MKKLRRLASRHSLLIGCLLGFFVFLAFFLISAAFVVRKQLDLFSEQLTSKAEAARKIVAEQDKLLALLNRKYQPLCTPDNLAALRVLLFEQSFVRDIGLYNDQGELYCTTGLGRLKQPLPDNAPDFEPFGPGFRSVWMDMPLLLGNGRFRATIVRQGRFNIVIDRSAIADLLDDSVDMVHLRLPSGRVQTTFTRPGTPPETAIRLRTLVDIHTSGQRFDWELGAIVTTEQVFGSGHVIQSVHPSQKILGSHGELVAMLFVAASFLGMLTAASTMTRLNDIHSLEHRIDTLLRYANVVCLYQPIIDLENGRTVGCEVLMRLADGDELIFPDAVLPVIARKGLAWRLDSLVLEKGLSEIATRLPPGDSFKIAFNLFPESVRFEALDRLIQSCLTHLARSDLVVNLEVIEQSYHERMIDDIHKLKSAGYLISVDDFGTGYSNLGMVMKLAPDFIKIDKSFVFEMEDASVRSSLIPQIVSIAAAVNSRTIAEGIENTLQASKLKTMGVHFGQGYLFGKPMDAERFLRYLQESETLSATTANAAHVESTP